MGNYLILTWYTIFLVAMFLIFKNILRLNKGKGAETESKKEFGHLYITFGILLVIFGILQVLIGERNFASYSQIGIGLVFVYNAYNT